MLHDVYNSFTWTFLLWALWLFSCWWWWWGGPDHIWKPLYGPNVTDVIQSEGVRPCNFLTNHGAKKVTVTAPSSPLLSAAILSHLIEPLSTEVNGHPPVTTIVISDGDVQVFAPCRDTTVSLCIIYSMLSLWENTIPAKVSPLLWCWANGTARNVYKFTAALRMLLPLSI